MITDPSEVTRVESLIKHKYGLEFRVVTLVETIAARGRKPRVVLRITPTRRRPGIFAALPALDSWGKG